MADTSKNQVDIIPRDLDMSRVFEFEVIKVDRNDFRQNKYTLTSIMGAHHQPGKSGDQKMLDSITKGVNVGDFVKLPNGNIYKRVRGGFKKTTDEDMAELITSQL